MSESDQPSAQKTQKKPKSPLWKVSVFLVVIVFLLLDIAAGGYVWLMNEYSATSVLQEDKVVEIPHGSGVSKIAQILKSEGVIDNPLAFRIVLRFKNLDKALKAGEFLFPAQVTPEMAAHILIEGKTVLHRVTIPEGLTSVEIITLLNHEQGLEEMVMQTPPEGSLLPETYSFSKGTTRATIVSHMQEAMQHTLDELWTNRQDGLPLRSKAEALILASIVEKETAVHAERAKVAGVFINRLNKRMRLQTDPTVVYGITLGQEPLGRPLSRKDLQTPTPYNTYTNYGLPPSPICNPGRASIEAVLNPAETDALYFVADGSGGHAFSNSLDAHNRNVAKWRKIERSQK
ncbi:MAG: endolytic transglycosylase MltG [Methylocystaceae bacterium]|nr:endolytic transglycosylase MltG [Methylocystaceae bacterium]